VTYSFLLDDSFVGTSMSTNGFFDSKNFDTEEPDIKKTLIRQAGGVDFKKDFKFEDEILKVWYAFLNDF
jgi:hypothetical protein